MGHVCVAMEDRDRSCDTRLSERGGIPKYSRKAFNHEEHEGHEGIWTCFVFLLFVVSFANAAVGDLHQPVDG